MQTMQTMQIPGCPSPRETLPDHANHANHANPHTARQNDEILELIDQRGISFPMTYLHINIGQSATYKLIRPDIASPFREPE